MGVDMVEIDIRETKDGQLVLMHDSNIDRTTTGKGKIKNWTLKELKTLNLVDSFGSVTVNKIPTLKEALLLSKDKILINLDKSYNYIDKCYEVMSDTGTIKQVVFKGQKTRSQVENNYGQYMNQIYFMPIFQLPNKNAKKNIEDYLNYRVPVAFEIIVNREIAGVFNEFENIRKKGAKIWVNALSEKYSAGHDDEKAKLDPSIYDWYIKNNVNMIQTDQPELLINYLREKGLHW
jgi:glycerophosphoryl diester phosphodiesterase